MMEWTDRHCRYFLRQFSPHVHLYTEMIHAAAILRGNTGRLLQHSPEEQPLALQLGGSDPAQLAAAARHAEDAGYVEVNLNCGCPSDKVRQGAFGACLMLQPALVARCIEAMKAAVRVPVTVKFRIGVVDDGGGGGGRARGQEFDAEDAATLARFSRELLDAGADLFIVHARKAVLGGLSPHENRTVPPLRYEAVLQLKEFLQAEAGVRQVPVVVNGGLRSCEAVLDALASFDGVMIGREAYHRPALLAELEAALHPGSTAPDIAAILDRMHGYARREVAAGTPLNAITRHMLGLMSGRPGARALRHTLSAEVQRGTPVDGVFARAIAIARGEEAALSRAG